MKKLKFTLSLLLAMIVLGANVVKAQTEYEANHYGFIGVSAKLTGCEFFDDDVTIEQVVVDNYGYGYTGPIGMIAFPVQYIQKNDTVLYSSGLYNLKAKGSFAALPNSCLFPGHIAGVGDAGPLYWPYGAGRYVESPGVALPPLTPLHDYSWDDLTKKWICNNVPHNQYHNPLAASSGTGNLMFWLQKGGGQVDVYNEIKIKLAYINGNELAPVVKVKITLGQFKLEETAATPANGNTAARAYVLYPLDNVAPIEQIVRHSERYFRPHMTNGTETAEYIYRDQLLPLLSKFSSPIYIYSMEYIITTNDEQDDPGTTDHEPPTSVNPPATPRIVILDVENGITSNKANGNHFVALQSDFVFTVNSSTPISVTTDPARPKLPTGGIEVTDKGNGKYDVNIRRITDSGMKISVASVAPTSGAGDDDELTGNATIATDKVWASGGTLYMETATPATISVYSITGQLVKQVFVNGSDNVTLPKGLYIVQMNGKAYKVVN